MRANKLSLNEETEQNNVGLSYSVNTPLRLHSKYLIGAIGTKSFSVRSLLLEKLSLLYRA